MMVLLKGDKSDDVTIFGRGVQSIDIYCQIWHICGKKKLCYGHICFKVRPFMNKLPHLKLFLSHVTIGDEDRLNGKWFCDKWFIGLLK